MADYLDDFERPDAPTLGSDWDRPGHPPTAWWAIVSGRARVSTLLPPALWYNILAYYRYPATGKAIYTEAEVALQGANQAAIMIYLGVGNLFTLGSSWSGGVRTVYRAFQAGPFAHSWPVTEESGILRLAFDGITTFTCYWNGLLEYTYTGAFPSVDINYGHIWISYAATYGGGYPYYEWWLLGPKSKKDKPVYLVGQKDGAEDGIIHACVTNDTSAVPGVTEDEDGIITVVAPRTVSSTGDGVLVIE